MQGVLGLERELAAEKGEEHAVPLDFPVRWVIGAPLPHLLCDDTKIRLIFYVAEGFSGESGARIEIVDPRSKAPVLLALVEFQAAAASRLGDPNDEVFHGHPLAGRGQEPFCAQEVLNSKWAAEIQAVNSVHAR